MTPEQKANVRAWVAALRSGEFEQGKFALRNGDRYCCWGVACELYDRVHGGVGWDGTEDAHAPLFNGSAGLPPVGVHQWLGVPRARLGLDDSERLARMNDSGSSFAEIADAIEAEYLTEAS